MNYKFLIAILIFLTVLSPNIGAFADSGADITISSADAITGGNVTVSLSIYSSSGYCGGQIVISYDSKVLELIGITREKDIILIKETKALGPDIFAIAFAGSQKIQSGILCSFNFKVVSEAGGITKVSILPNGTEINDGVSNFTGSLLKTNNGTINIKGVEAGGSAGNRGDGTVSPYIAGLDKANDKLLDSLNGPNPEKTVSDALAALKESFADIKTNTKENAEQFLYKERELVKNAGSVIKELDEKKALNSLVEIIQANGEFFKDTELAASERVKVNRDIFSIGEALIKDSCNIKVIPSKEGNKAKISLGNIDTSVFKSLADKASGLAQNIKAEMEKSYMKKAPAAEVTVTAEGIRFPGSVSIELPPNTISDIRSKNTPVKLYTGNLTLNIPVPPSNLLLNGKSFNIDLDSKSDNEFTFNLTSSALSPEICIPYNLKQDEDPNYLAVSFKDSGTGKVSRIPSNYDTSTGCISFKVRGNGTYRFVNEKIRFKDVGGMLSWAKYPIESLASKGVVNGTAPDMFMPGNSITRAEFVKIVVNVLDIEEKGAVSDYSDVKKEMWYYSTIAVAEKAGLLADLSRGLFTPQTPIKRRDMVYILYRALNEPVSADNNLFLGKFKDRKLIGQKAEDAFAVCIKYGLMSGKPGGIIDPDGNATRAEAAKMVKALFDQLL